MIDDVQAGGRSNVIPIRPDSSGTIRVDVTAERMLRVKMRMNELGMDQAALAEATGLSNSAISQLLKQRIRKTRHYPAMARALKVNLSWILAETDQRIITEWQGVEVSEKDLPDLLDQAEFARSNVDTIQTDDIPADQFERRGHTLPVPQIDLMQVSHHHMHGIPVKLQTHLIGRDVIQGYTRGDPGHVMTLQGIGDVMQPTLLNSDLIFLDASRRTLNEQDAIWLFRFGGALMMRRVRKTPNGLRLMADNPLLSDDVAYDGDLEFLGLVVGCLRRF